LRKKFAIILTKIKNLKGSKMENIIIRVTNKDDVHFASIISAQIAASAVERKTGIAKRTPNYIAEKISKGNAIIAIDTELNAPAGFCYIESWGQKKYVANSGLIIFPQYRCLGLARKIKEKAFKWSTKKFPNAKLFGLTTNLAVMKINTSLGYRPVTYSELTSDQSFWDGCKGCVNHKILKANDQKNCLCTGMIFDPDNSVKTDGDKNE